MEVNKRLLFIAGCIALITSAFSFQMRGNIADAVGTDFRLDKEALGAFMGAAFLGMCVSMLVFSPFCDAIGMGKVLGLAWLSHLVGIAGTIFALTLADVEFVKTVTDGVATVVTTAFSWFSSFPAGDKTSFWVLWSATFLIGAGNGLVEVAINPLAATLYPDEKTHKMNVLHAWWPGGLIIAGLVALYVIDPALGLNNTNKAEIKPENVTLGWKVKMAFLALPLVVYGLIAMTQRFPKTERAASNVSTGQMWGQLVRPLFIIWCFCMLLTAATELGVNSWQESVLTRTTGVSGTLIFVYTAGLMFMLRFFAGPIAHALSPIGMLLVSSVFAAGGLFWLSFADGPISAFASATVFGVGIAYFWPTMLGVTAEKFPKGGALALGMVGSMGNLAIFFILPLMGGIYDSFTVANIPENVQTLTFNDADNKIQKVVIEPKDGRDSGRAGSLMPPAMFDFLYPAGKAKLNPDLTAVARTQLTEESRDVIGKAEAQGAAFAYRRVAILPCILIAVFGLIVLVDKLRGGYKAEVIAPTTR